MSSTLCLFRQDPARGGLLKAIISSLAVGLLMRIAPGLAEEISDLRVGDLPGGFAPMYVLLTALVVTFVLGANAWTRSSRLALGLPFSTRQVWTVRIVSLLGVALISVAALTVTMGLSVDLVSRQLTVNPVIALAGVRAAATVVLLLFLFQLPHSERDRIPITAPYVIYVIFCAVFVLAFSATMIPSLAGTLALSIAALALGVYLFVRNPVTFSIEPTAAESEIARGTPPETVSGKETGAESHDEDATGHGLTRLGLHWILFRGLKGNLLMWFLMVIVGLSSGVATAEFLQGTNAFMALFFLVIYHLPLLQGALESMAEFDPLPISRSVLWAHVAGPIIVSMSLGAGAAMAVFLLNPTPFTQIRFDDCCVKVPWDYLVLSPDGRAPTVASPWGETYTPQSRPLWRGRPISLYDPYEVGPESSPGFVEFQMRRAVEAVYGIPVPDRLLNPTYQAPPNIVGGVERGAFTLDTTRGRISSDRNRTAAVALLLLSFLGAALMLPSLLQFGTSVHRKLYKRAEIGFLIMLGVVAVAVSIGRLLGFTQVWYVGALFSVGTRSLAHWLPLSTSFLWFFCVTFWAGSYLLLERVFRSIEFPREKTMNRFAE
jgi:hypothetical protein